MHEEKSSTFSKANQRVAYLRLRQRMGLATPDELAELRKSFIVVGDPAGGGLAVPSPCASVDEWRQRFVAPQQ